MKFKYLQEGGEMAPEAMPQEAAAPEAAAPEQGQGGPEEQLQQIAAQLVEMLMQQIGDPQAIMMILQMAAEMVGQAGQAAPAPAYQRQGGRLVRVK